MHPREIAYRLSRNMSARMDKIRRSPTETISPPENFLRHQGLLHPTRSLEEQLRELLQQLRDTPVLPWQKENAGFPAVVFEQEWIEEKNRILQ